MMTYHDGRKILDKMSRYSVRMCKDVEKIADQIPKNVDTVFRPKKPR